jgi:integrase
MIRVFVRKKPDRDFYQLYYVDPFTGKDVTRSANTDNKALAEREAQNWETELTEQGIGGGEVSWDVFRLRFTDEHLAHLAINTLKAYESSLNAFENAVGKPKSLSLVNPSLMSKLRTKLIANAGSVETAKKYMRHIQGALSWAETIGLIKKAPSFIGVPGSGKMKGRPVTDKEFQSMIDNANVEKPGEFAKTTAVEVEKRIFTMKSIWESGLRVGELSRCHWDSGPIRFDLDSGAYPQMIFSVGSHKSRRQEIVPMTPEFAALLRKRFPEGSRKGRVFDLAQPDRVISAIGVAAKIIVNEDGKCASAHDLRRSFATRWSYKVRPVILQRMMRHKSITTTLTYYVMQEADDVGAEIWRVPPFVPQTPENPKRKSKLTPKNIGKK